MPRGKPPGIGRFHALFRDFCRPAAFDLGLSLAPLRALPPTAKQRPFLPPLAAFAPPTLRISHSPARHRVTAARSHASIANRKTNSRARNGSTAADGSRWKTAEQKRRFVTERMYTYYPPTHPSTAVFSPLRLRRRDGRLDPALYAPTQERTQGAAKTPTRANRCHASYATWRLLAISQCNRVRNPSLPKATERDANSATLCDPLPNNFPPEGIRRKTWS